MVLGLAARVGRRASLPAGRLPRRVVLHRALAALHGDPRPGPHRDDHHVRVGPVARDRVGPERSASGRSSGRSLTSPRRCRRSSTSSRRSRSSTRPVHGDRRRGHLRGAARHPAGRRRYPGRPAGHSGSLALIRATARQRLWKVDLPLDGRSSWPATRRVILVLAMVVIAGLVGAGALGYDVIAGFAQGTGLREGAGRRDGDRAARDHARPDHPGRRVTPVRVGQSRLSGGQRTSSEASPKQGLTDLSGTDSWSARP